jgi:hypothetical protein
MSGGAWGYKQWEIVEEADRIKKFLSAVAKTEHIVDWAVCGDTSKEEAAQELFDLWESVFNEVYDR